MERKEAIEIIRGARCTSPLRDALECLIPELAESEDERIVRCIEVALTDVDEQRFKDFGTTLKDCIAYLEKQKEQKPVSTEDMPYITDEHFYEIEPVDSFKYKLAEYMTRCCTKKEGPYGYEYGISAETILKMAEEELLKRGVVQKPADRFEEARKKYQVEWSEEDENRLNAVVELLENSSAIHPNYSRRKLIIWLKSLRPSWKPSEQEKGALRTAIHILTDERSFPKAAAQLQNILDAFEGKESRKDWKPSEEQVEALRNAVHKLAKSDVADSVRLSIMYDNIKKLM